MKSIVLLALFISTHANSANYATCILDKVPGTSNSITYISIMEICLKEYPSAFKGVKQGSGGGLFGFKDGSACTIKKAKDTPFTPAARTIQIACNCLYEASTLDGQLCPSMAEIK